MSEITDHAEVISEAELLQSTKPQPAPLGYLNSMAHADNTEAGNLPPQPAPVMPQPAEQSLNIGNFIDEKVAVEMVDIGLPILIGGMLKSFANKKVPKSQLQASASEKEMLYPPMKEVLKQMQIKVTNPFEALVYAAICVYGSKTAVVFMDDSYTIPAKASKSSNSMSDDLNELAASDSGKRGRGRPRKNNG